MLRRFKLPGLLFLLLLATLSCNLLQPSSTPQTLLQEQQSTLVTPVIEPTQPAGMTATRPPEISNSITPDAQALSNGEIARKYLDDFVGKFGPRESGSNSESRAAVYIQAALEEMGYSVALQPFSFSTENDEQLESANVIATRPGDSDQVVVIGAHYDSTADADGVDDNASGVAVLLATAQLVKTTNNFYTIQFIAFGAEENDLDGSRYYVSQLSRADRQNIAFMVNLDSLAVGDRNYLYGDPGNAGRLIDSLVKAANQIGAELETKTARDLDNSDGTPCECADYGPFQEVGIPFVYFEATNWDLGDKDGMTQVDPDQGDQGVIRHTEYDRIETIDELFPGRIEDHLNLYVTLLVDMLKNFRD